jgi:SAM-dependent methyltransferase
MHPLVWDADMIARFWDFAAQSPAIANEYFTKQVGVGLTSFLLLLEPRPGRILDYGCGRGHLIEELSRRGLRCTGCDSSAESIAATNARIGALPGAEQAKVVEGGTLPYGDGAFDTVIACETVEHVLPDRLPGLLGEFHRVLKPGSGRLLITTPHDEDLALSQVGCPCCGSIFHRFQHVRSFDRQQLTEAVERSGFTTRRCDATDFSRFQRPPPSRSLVKAQVQSMVRILRQSHRQFLEMLDVLAPRQHDAGGRWLRSQVGEGPHLFWYGTRG